mmetsp:Transcript_3106/g.11916  ORF Transcript_3106/g.11916 Transcript_3106/m.11916 type:complete len:347 (+) Transcript_3106:1139-2179(+)
MKQRMARHGGNRVRLVQTQRVWFVRRNIPRFPSLEDEFGATLQRRRSLGDVRLHELRRRNGSFVQFSRRVQPIHLALALVRRERFELFRVDLRANRGIVDIRQIALGVLRVIVLAQARLQVNHSPARDRHQLQLVRPIILTRRFLQPPQHHLPVVPPFALVRSPDAARRVRKILPHVLHPVERPSHDDIIPPKRLLQPPVHPAVPLQASVSVLLREFLAIHPTSRPPRLERRRSLDAPRADRPAPHHERSIPRSRVVVRVALVIGLESTLRPLAADAQPQRFHARASQSRAERRRRRIRRSLRHHRLAASRARRTTRVSRRDVERARARAFTLARGVEPRRRAVRG